MKIVIDFERKKVTGLGGLSPQGKLDALKEMGFTAIWEQHQPDCSNQYDSGFLCICIPPGTSWVAPTEVKEFMGETYAQLREKGRNR